MFVNTIQKWLNIKPRSVKVAEAVIALAPAEEWERMNTSSENSPLRDIRELILILSKKSTCVYSMERSLTRAALLLADVKRENPWIARYKVFWFFADELFK